MATLLDVSMRRTGAFAFPAPRHASVESNDSWWDEGKRLQHLTDPCAIAKAK